MGIVLAWVSREPPSSMMTASWPSPCSIFFGQRELDVQRAGVGGLGVFLEDGLAVDRGEDAQLGAGRRRPLPPAGP